MNDADAVGFMVEPFRAVKGSSKHILVHLNTPEDVKKFLKENNITKSFLTKKGIPASEITSLLSKGVSSVPTLTEVVESLGFRLKSVPKECVFYGSQGVVCLDF